MIYTIEEFCNDVQPITTLEIGKMLENAGYKQTDENNVYTCSGPHHMRCCLKLAHEDAQILIKAGLPLSANMGDICHYLMHRFDKENKENPEIWNRDLVILNINEIKKLAKMDL